MKSIRQKNSSVVLLLTSNVIATACSFPLVAFRRTFCGFCRNTLTRLSNS